MTDDTPTPRYPVRDPAPGPCVILDLPKLWKAVTTEMDRRGISEDKQLSELTGIDRTTLGRVRRRAVNGEIVHGQRGGISVNAYLTLVSFAQNGQAAAYGLVLRGGIPAFHLISPLDDNQSTTETDTQE